MNDQFDELLNWMIFAYEKLIKKVQNIENEGKRNTGQLFLECWILTRWILEHALETGQKDRVSEERIKLSKLAVKTIFDRITREKLSKTNLSPESLSDTIASAIESYNRIITDLGYPNCWPTIGEVVVFNIFDISDESLAEIFIYGNMLQMDDLVNLIQQLHSSANELWNAWYE